MDINTDYNNPFQGLSTDDLNKSLIDAIRARDKKEDHEKIKALLKAGAEINTTDDQGCTPLMLAIFNKDDIIFNMLVEMGADIHQKSAAQLTAFMYAAATGYLQGAHLLLAKGADMHAVDMQGMAAFWYAKFNIKTEMMHYLLSMMSSEDHQSLVNLFYSKTFVTNNDFIKIEKIQKYHEFCIFIVNFDDELKANRKKLCTLLFSNKDGLPHHDIIQYPLMPTLNTTLLPEMMEKIFDLKFLCLANQFPEWYKLSCLKQDIKFFLNWKPVPPKSYGEVAHNALATVQNSFLSAFESAKNYIAPSNTPKRKREDDDEGPDNQKKPKL